MSARLNSAACSRMSLRLNFEPRVDVRQPTKESLIVRQRCLDGVKFESTLDVPRSDANSTVLSWGGFDHSRTTYAGRIVDERSSQQSGQLVREFRGRRISLVKCNEFVVCQQ